jgi:hypothetical protein
MVTVAPVIGSPVRASLTVPVIPPVVAFRVRAKLSVAVPPTVTVAVPVAPSYPLAEANTECCPSERRDIV